jgi:hypothetical protein
MRPANFEQCFDTGAFSPETFLALQKAIGAFLKGETSVRGNSMILCNNFTNQLILV